MAGNKITEKMAKVDRKTKAGRWDCEIVEAFDNLCQNILPGSSNQLACLPAESVAKLKNDLDRVTLVVNELNAKMDASLEVRYRDKIRNSLIVSKKSRGNIHFNDGHTVDVIVDIPEIVDWDQELLKDAYKRFLVSGTDPEELIGARWFIEADKYSKWNGFLQSAFSKARIVRSGKIKFKLGLIKEKF